MTLQKPECSATAGVIKAFEKMKEIRIADPRKLVLDSCSFKYPAHNFYDLNTRNSDCYFFESKKVVFSAFEIEATCNKNYALSEVDTGNSLTLHIRAPLFNLCEEFVLFGFSIVESKNKVVDYIFEYDCQGNEWHYIDHFSKIIFYDYGLDHKLSENADTALIKENYAKYLKKIDTLFERTSQKRKHKLPDQ